MGEVQAAFADKRIIKSLIPVIALMMWGTTSFWSFIMMDDFIFVMLMSLLIAIGSFIPTIVLTIVCTVLSSKKALIVSENGICGKLFSGKTVSLTLDMIGSVESYGLNGIKIIAKNGMVYKYSFMDNRDYICLALSDLGVMVNPKLVKDKNAVILSETDRKKNKVLPLVSLVVAIVSNILMSVSSIWFNSDGNWYSYTTTSYSYWGTPYYDYHSGYNYYPYEMPTTYLAVLAWIVAVVVLIVYIVQANHRLSVSPEAVRGVNGFGKVTVMPVNQIVSVSSQASNSSVVIVCSGIKRTYCMISNNMHIVQTIRSFMPNSFVPVQSVPVQPYAPQTQYVMPVRQYITPVQPVTVNSTGAADEIKKLKELLDMGAVTQEEFEIKKKQILGL